MVWTLSRSAGARTSVSGIFPCHLIPPEADGVEVVQLPCMPLIDCPCLTAVEKGGEDCRSAYLDLSFGCHFSPIADVFVESAKSGTRFSESGVRLVIHDDGS